MDPELGSAARALELAWLQGAALPRESSQAQLIAAAPAREERQNQQVLKHPEMVKRSSEQLSLETTARRFVSLSACYQRAGRAGQNSNPSQQHPYELALIAAHPMKEQNSRLMQRRTQPQFRRPHALPDKAKLLTDR